VMSASRGNREDPVAALRLMTTLIRLDKNDEPAGVATVRSREVVVRFAVHDLEEHGQIGDAPNSAKPTMKPTTLVLESRV